MLVLALVKAGGAVVISRREGEKGEEEEEMEERKGKGQKRGKSDSDDDGDININIDSNSDSDSNLESSPFHVQPVEESREHQIQISQLYSTKPSFPRLNMAVVPRLTLVSQNQAMRIPMIALLLRRPIAQRPMHLRIHVAEDALGGRDEVWTVRRLTFTQFLRAMPVVRTRDQMGESGQPGAFFEATAAGCLFLPAGSVIHVVVGGSGRIAVVPEVGLPIKINWPCPWRWILDFMLTDAVVGHVSLPEHCWPGAVETWVVVVVGGEVGEVLHVDLQCGGGDSVAVVVVDPCACCLRIGELNGWLEGVTSSGSFICMCGTYLVCGRFRRERWNNTSPYRSRGPYPQAIRDVYHPPTSELCRQCRARSSSE